MYVSIYDIIQTKKGVEIMTKKHITTSIDEDVVKNLKKLAIDKGVNYNVLIEESIKDILLKYALSHKEQPRQRG